MHFRAHERLVLLHGDRIPVNREPISGRVACSAGIEVEDASPSIVNHTMSGRPSLARPTFSRGSPNFPSTMPAYPRATAGK